jgi:hypothetical protein
MEGGRACLPYLPVSLPPDFFFPFVTACETLACTDFCRGPLLLCRQLLEGPRVKWIKVLPVLEHNQKYFQWNLKVLELPKTSGPWQRNNYLHAFTGVLIEEEAYGPTQGEQGRGNWSNRVIARINR